MPERELRWPVDNYSTGDFYKFGDRVGSRGGWVSHLGDDVKASAGTVVRAVGAGEVAQAETRAGSGEKRNWGGVILIKHAGFYSVYGHLDNLKVQVGDRVEAGEEIGRVARALTPENGWWQNEHLHFAIYTGSWRPGVALPGYYRWWQFRTKKKWWRDPQDFIKNYNDG